ncbi:MAG: CbtA family protein [Casimicrobiaceae bacterium]
MFRRIVSSAALAGVCSGLLLTAIQQVEVTPLIRKAEVSEEAAVALAKSAHGHLSSGPPHAAWAPHTGSERLVATAVSNTFLATGFALLLAAAISLQGQTGWRAGLIWGTAGYAVFFVAPSLGLPPELPGVQAAPLRERELWWVVTVLFSAAGLWLVAFSRQSMIRVLGLVLLAAPHAIGAPQPAMHGATAPIELAQDFVRATYLANAAFWLALGGLLGYLYKAGE